MSYLVIGSGSIGTRHAGNLETLGAQVEGLSLRALGLDGILQRIATGPAAQGAVIATATQLRLPLIKACADRNIPIYIEKPLAYTPGELDAIYRALTPVAERSMAGFMMRYHPLLPAMIDCVQGAEPYRFDAEIGHDVTQWRANWSFADSYAARPEGGGVLLDLCHELDLAHVLFPDTDLGTVQSLGHKDFPGVDMASQITLTGPSVTGTVSMDYLSPVSLRRLRVRGQRAVLDIDLLQSRITRHVPGQSAEVIETQFDRNDMFLDAMRDFMALAEGRMPTATTPARPRVDLARPSCDKIAAAWAARAFTGTIQKDLS